MITTSLDDPPPDAGVEAAEPTELPGAVLPGAVVVLPPEVVALPELLQAVVVASTAATPIGSSRRGQLDFRLMDLSFRRGTDDGVRAGRG